MVNTITFGTKADYSGEVRTLVTSETGSANSDIFKSIVEGKNSNTDYGLVPQIDLQDQSTGYFVLDSASRDKSLADLIIKLQNKKTLLSYAEKPKLGLTTGSNKIFIWEKAAVEAISMTDYERSLFKPLINGSSLTTVTEKDLPDSYVMYIDHAVDEKKIPNLLKWIKSQPAYEKLMKRREVISGRIRSFELWWPREQWIFESKSTIYFQKREITPRFTLNTQGYYLKDDSYAITLNQTYRGYEKYTNVILAVLNSTITHFWLVKLGRKKGKVLELYPEVLVTIPMPNVELIKETDIIELDDAINSGRLLDVADRFAVKWFDLEMEDISIMNKYILDNQ